MDFISGLATQNGVRTLTVGAPILLWLAGLLGKSLVVEFNFAVSGADLAFCGIAVCASAAVRTISANAGMNLLSFYIILGLVTAIIWLVCLLLAKGAIKFAKRYDVLPSNRIDLLKSLGCSSLSVVISGVALCMDISYAVRATS